MYLLSITNKTQRYAIFFITVNALHVSGGFSAHHQELKSCTHSIRYTSSSFIRMAMYLDVNCLSLHDFFARHIPDAVCTVFELLMIGGETA
jgi:hypothetical protein